MVARGTVDCATALRVEAGYAAAIKAGDLQGNGGGAPVAVDGWTCESYPTQEVLRTGDASECHTTSAEVIAVLSLSTASAPRRRPRAGCTASPRSWRSAGVAGELDRHLALHLGGR